jgi:hypothetical protein
MYRIPGGVDLYSKSLVYQRIKFKVAHFALKVLISIPVLRMNTGTMCIYARSSYSKVDAVEQRYMLNSGVRGTKDWNPRIEVDCYSTLIRVLCQLSSPSHPSTYHSTGKPQ